MPAVVLRSTPQVGEAGGSRDADAVGRCGTGGISSRWSVTAVMVSPISLDTAPSILAMLFLSRPRLTHVFGTGILRGGREWPPTFLGKRPPCNNGIIWETLAFGVLGQSRGGERGLLFHDDESNLVPPPHRCEKKSSQPHGCRGRNVLMDFHRSLAAEPDLAQQAEMGLPRLWRFPTRTRMRSSGL